MHRNDYNEAIDVYELAEALDQPTDPKLIRYRRQGGSELAYLEWHEVNRILNVRCPGWSGGRTAEGVDG